MRKLFTVFIVLLTICSFAQAQRKQERGYNVYLWGAAANGTTDDKVPIDRLDDWANSEGLVLYFPTGTYRIGSDLTIDSDCEFETSAQLNIDGGATVTFNGLINANQERIFIGDGSISLTPQAIVHAAWWGGGNFVGIGTTEPMYKLEVNGDIYGDELRLKPRKLEPLVTFVFDDGNATDYTVMKPVFDSQGEVACSAIVTDLVGTTGMLTWAKILELQGAGWEILSHSISHPDLTTLTEAQIRDELDGSKQELTNHGIVVKNFVYPWHYHNETVRRITREYYRSARGSSGINPHVLETYALSSAQADDHTKLDTFKTYVDTAESEGKWLIFHIHGTDSNDATAINELIDYIQAKGMQIVTVNQALDLVGNMIDGDNLAISEQGLRTRDINVGIGDTATIRYPGHYLYLQNEGYNAHYVVMRPGGSTSGNLFTTLSLQNSDTSTPPAYTTGVLLDSSNISVFNNGIRVSGDTGAPGSGAGVEIGYYADNYGWIQTFNSKPLMLNPLGNYIEVGHGLRIQGSSAITTGVGIEMNYGSIADSGVIMAYDRDTSSYKDLRLRKIIVDNTTAKFSGSGAPSSGAGIELSGGTGINAIVAYNRDTPSYLDLLIRGATVSLGAGGNTHLYIDASGKVGIGTTGPDRKLDVRDHSNPQLRLTHTDGSVYAEMQADSAGDLIITVSGDEVKIPEEIVYTPSTDQVIDAVGDTILANATIVFLDPNGDYTLTSAPTIANGSKGQILMIMCNNAEANGVTVQDQDSLASSNLQLGAATRAISGKDVLTLVFDGVDWVEQSYADN